MIELSRDRLSNKKYSLHEFYWGIKRKKELFRYIKITFKNHFVLSGIISKISKSIYVELSMIWKYMNE